MKYNYTFKFSHTVGMLGVLELFCARMAWWFWGYAAASGSARAWWAFLVCGLVWIATQTAYVTVDKK